MLTCRRRRHVGASSEFGSRKVALVDERVEHAQPRAVADESGDNGDVGDTDGRIAIWFASGSLRALSALAHLVRLARQYFGSDRNIRRVWSACGRRVRSL